MLPNNLDLMNMMVLERQQQIKAQVRLQSVGYVALHPIRHFIGRLLTRGGERLSGEGRRAAEIAPDSPLAPVFALRHPTPIEERKLDQAA